MTCNGSGLINVLLHIHSIYIYFNYLLIIWRHFFSFSPLKSLIPLKCEFSWLFRAQSYISPQNLLIAPSTQCYFYFSFTVVYYVSQSSVINNLL